MPPTKKAVTNSPQDDLTPEEIIEGLKAEITKMRRNEAKQYASTFSLQEQVKALQKENISLHSQIPTPEEKLKAISDRLTITQTIVEPPNQEWIRK